MANELPSCGRVGRRCDVAACHADDEAARSTSAASQRPAIICAGSQLDCLTFQFIAEIAVTSVIVRRAPFMCALAALVSCPPFRLVTVNKPRALTQPIILSLFTFFHRLPDGPRSDMCPLSVSHTQHNDKLNQSSATGGASRAGTTMRRQAPCAVATIARRGSPTPRPRAHRRATVYITRKFRGRPGTPGHAHTDACWGAAAPPRTTDTTTPRDTTRQTRHTTYSIRGRERAT